MPYSTQVGVAIFSWQGTHYTHLLKLHSKTNLILGGFLLKVWFFVPSGRLLNFLWVLEKPPKSDSFCYETSTSKSSRCGRGVKRGGDWGWGEGSECTTACVGLSPTARACCVHSAEADRLLVCFLRSSRSSHVARQGAGTPGPRLRQAACTGGAACCALETPAQEGADRFVPAPCRPVAVFPAECSAH